MILKKINSNIEKIERINFRNVNFKCNVIELIKIFFNNNNPKKLVIIDLRKNNIKTTAKINNIISKIRKKNVQIIC